jgi:alpha-ribazole phosphatase
MSRVVFIRHAETEMAGRFCGHSDPELSAQGRMQITTLAHLLSAEPIDTVYSSDLRRASATAQAIATVREIPQVVRPGLREISFGQWEGLSWEQIEQMDPAYARRWVERYPHVPAPSGESFQDFEARVLEEVNHLLQGKPGPIAVVTHGGVIRVVLQHLCGCSDEEAWQQTRAYCCIVRFE